MKTRRQKGTSKKAERQKEIAGKFPFHRVLGFKKMAQKIKSKIVGEK